MQLDPSLAPWLFVRGARSLRGRCSRRVPGGVVDPRPQNDSPVHVAGLRYVDPATPDLLTVFEALLPSPCKSLAFASTRLDAVLGGTDVVPRSDVNPYDVVVFAEVEDESAVSVGDFADTFSQVEGGRTLSAIAPASASRYASAVATLDGLAIDLTEELEWRAAATWT